MLTFHGEPVETRKRFFKKTGDKSGIVVFEDGTPVPCQDCGVSLTTETGVDVNCDFIEYTCYTAYVQHTRDMGARFYCSGCGPKHPARHDTVHGYPYEGCEHRARYDT